MRSRAAASILSGAGFKEVRSMAGGMKAWEGLTAEGPPEAGMVHFSAATRPLEMAALAWVLEEGSRRFYSGLNDLVPEEEAKDLFSDLSAAEEQHKIALVGLYQEFSRKSPDPQFARALFPSEDLEDVMEGGMKVSEGLQWARGKALAEIIDLSIALEANSYDLYIKMERRVEDPQGKKIFKLLFLEEKAHLQRLSFMLGKKM